jgi:membrane protein implicated in regulation of membrane protease activity
LNRIVGALKATYNFFAGDAIILGGVALAFIVGTLLVRVLQAPNALSALVFVALIVAGLVVTLGRELRGRPRTRR